MPYLLTITEFIIINNPVLQLQFIGQITVINFLFSFFFFFGWVAWDREAES